MQASFSYTLNPILARAFVQRTRDYTNLRFTWSTTQDQVLWARETEQHTHPPPPPPSQTFVVFSLKPLDANLVEVGVVLLRES